MPPNNVTEGTSAPHTVHRDTSPDQNHTQPATRSVDRSVMWLHSVDDQPEEEAVMQATGFWKYGLVITLWTSWWIRDLR